MSDQQLANFNARIKRIKDPKNIYWTDHETGMNIPRRISKGTIIAHNFRKKEGLMPLLMSVVLGVICLMAARYIRFHFAEVPDSGTEAMTLTVMDFGIAAFLAMIVGGIVRLKTFRNVMGQLGGIALMLVAMHNLVWIYPAEFARFYSQDYVDQVMALTAPQSLYVNGEVFTL